MVWNCKRWPGTKTGSLAGKEYRDMMGSNPGTRSELSGEKVTGASQRDKEGIKYAEVLEYLRQEAANGEI